MQAAKATAPSTDLTAFPSHLAHVKKSGSHHIMCGALSPDGSLLAFSDIQGVRCYKLQGAQAAEQAATADGRTDQAPAAEATEAADQASNGAAPGAEATQAAVVDSATGKQTPAQAEAKQTLQRLSMPEDVPAFQEMHFRPQSSHLVGLTPQGNLVVVDTDTSQVSTA